MCRSFIDYLSSTCYRQEMVLTYYAYVATGQMLSRSGIKGWKLCKKYVAEFQLGNAEKFLLKPDFSTFKEV